MFKHTLKNQNGVIEWGAIEKAIAAYTEEFSKMPQCIQGSYWDLKRVKECAVAAGYGTQVGAIVHPLGPIFLEIDGKAAEPYLYNPAQDAVKAALQSFTKGMPPSKATGGVVITFSDVAYEQLADYFTHHEIDIALGVNDLGGLRRPFQDFMGRDPNDTDKANSAARNWS